MQTRQKRVEQVLRQALEPEFLSVLDESHNHSGHGVETHLRVVVVSSVFEKLTRVARQQKIYSLLHSELQSGLHALALRTLTPAEWAAEGGVDRSQSPPCLGGDED